MLHVAPRGERTGTRNASPRPPRANTRRWLASLLVGLGGLTASHTSYAESHLEVVIRETTRPPDEGRILIDTTFINTGDAPFFLHMPSTLFGRTDDGLHGDRFVIKDADGERLSYRGQGAGSWGPPRLSHFVVIPAGETVHKEVDLTTGYEFSDAGDFTVRFAAELNIASLDLESAPRAEVEAVLENSQSSVESNEIVVRVRAPSSLRGGDRQGRRACDIRFTRNAHWRANARSRQAPLRQQAGSHRGEASTGRYGQHPSPASGLPTSSGTCFGQPQWSVGSRGVAIRERLRR